MECVLQVRDFEPSSEVDQGLMSTCTRTGLMMSGILSHSLIENDEEATRSERRRARARAARYSRFAAHSNENQFNEAFSDAYASRALPGFTSRYRAALPTRS